jgi:hypothetical protein
LNRDIDDLEVNYYPESIDDEVLLKLAGLYVSKELG